MVVKPFLVVCLLVAACSRNPAKVPPDVMVPPVGDAGAEPDAAPSDDCEAACREWRRLGCPEGNPTAGGATCEAVCRNTSAAGIDSSKQLSCASKATSCAALRACPY